MAILIATQLNFDTSFAALLSKNSEAVQQVEWVKEKTGGTVDLIVVLESLGQIDAQKRLIFARKLVSILEEQRWVSRADAEYPISFFEKRRALLLKKGELKQLSQAVKDDIARAKMRANPLFVDVRDEPEHPWADSERVLKGAQAGLIGWRSYSGTTAVGR